MKHRTVKAAALSPQQRRELDLLAGVCREHDRSKLPFYTEPARPGPRGESNHLLCYRDEALIGFVSLPCDDDLEVLGMVHPDHRRQGVGRTLVEEVKAECRLRGGVTFLLVGEASAPSGAAFARAIGGEYRFSEYQMELTSAPVRLDPPRHPSLQLRRSGPDDLETLVSIQADAFGDRGARPRERLTQWFHEPGQRFYVGTMDDRAIGMLRVSIDHSSPGLPTAYLNSFGVLPAYQGRGCGRQILSDIVADLQTESWESIRIEVNVENRNALLLYRACGFEETVEFQYFELAA